MKGSNNLKNCISLLVRILCPDFFEAQGGFFTANRSDQNWYYGIGVGITMPLYTGNRIESHVDEALARYEYQRAVVARTFERVNQENLGYDEQIQSMEVKLAYLERENELAVKVFNLAKNRYTKFQGSMIDLRDAIRELNRILDERDHTVSELSQAIVQKFLWNESFASGAR